MRSIKYPSVQRPRRSCPYRLPGGSMNLCLCQKALGLVAQYCRRLSEHYSLNGNGQ